MSRAWLAASYVALGWWTYACSPGSDSVSTEDDGAVITGVGGGGVGSGTQSSSAATMPSASSSSSSAVSSGSGGGGNNCPDMTFSEPNESESTAYKLQSGTTDDCDSSGGSISGKLSGPNDVDWFYYDGDDVSFCVVDPTRALTQSQGGAQLCKFFECKSGLVYTEVSCPSGTTAVFSPENRPGCCGNGGFSADNVNCGSSIDDDMFVYIRLMQPGATSTTCNEYTLDYHF